MSSVSFSICSLIYILIFAVVYFSRNRINLIENKIYSLLLITTLIGLTIDVFGYFSFKDMMTDSLKNLSIAKIYLVYYFSWCYLLTIYTYIISFKKGKNNNHKFFKYACIIYILITLIILILPIHININETSLYSYGISVNFVYTLSGICVLFMLICLIYNIKNIKKKEYIPLLAFIFFGSIVMLIQKHNPNLLLLITCQSIVTSLMYFTIENPDMRMIEELNKNKKLTEKNFEEKTNFLFKISQELKKPLIDIKKLSHEIINTDEIPIIKENAKKIKYNANQLHQYVNNALDVSEMDIKNVKIISGTYNTYNLFEEIKIRINHELKKQNKDIEFRYNVSNNLPEILCGDNTKLKQIITSILFNSIKHTNKGFIELNINSIIKYNACRLMIEIVDSGIGMELDKINDILNVNSCLTEEELKQIDKMNIDLNTTHKIIKILNGNLIIKSEINNGSTFIIIIDQQIKEQRKNETLTKMEQYGKDISLKNKILFLSTDEKIKEKLETNLNNVEIITSLYSNDCINRLESKEKFKCILIDEKIEEHTIEILKKIKNITKTPTIIMLNKNNEFLSKHYINDGFNDFIIKEDLKKQIKKINKYI